MMDAEDLEPRTKETRQRSLDQLSISDLKEYIKELEAEIERTAEVIQRKESHRHDVDAIFGQK